MKGFPGIKAYQDYCRMAVMRDGYILLNPQTGHKYFIDDYDILKEEMDIVNRRGFWDYYRQLKKDNPRAQEIMDFRYYTTRKANIEKRSINFRIQNRGAMCFKLASIKLFQYLKEHSLLNTVKYCVPVHDEINLECPKSISKEISEVLVKCMIAGARPFCDKVFLGADVEIGEHWIH